MSITHKDTRLDLRINDSQKEYLIHASKLKNMKLSAFVLNSALKEADDLIANNTTFYLSEEKWKAFTKLLDRPAVYKPKLKKLLTTKTVFHD